MPFSKEHHRNGHLLPLEPGMEPSPMTEFSAHPCDVCHKRVLLKMENRALSGQQGHRECLDFERQRRRDEAARHDG